jgi:hypothetical protein
MFKSLFLACSLVLVPLVACAGTAKNTKTKPAISMEAARKTALHRVPGATVKKEELEKEHGKLIYSFDLSVPGKTGIDEVQVDAMTGKVLSVEHETPKMEAKEKEEEKKEAKKQGSS